MHTHRLGSVGLVDDDDVSGAEVDAARVVGALVAHTVRVRNAHPQICMAAWTRPWPRPEHVPGWADLHDVHKDGRVLRASEIRIPGQSVPRKAAHYF